MQCREERALPSGAQVELVHGSQRAVVVEVGGALRSYEANRLQLLDGYEADEMCSGARGQSLIPWPNRLRNGRYVFDGETHQLPLSEPSKRNAIHGLVRWSNWTISARASHRILMEHALHPQPGYPFALRLAIEYCPASNFLRHQLVGSSLPACAPTASWRAGSGRRAASACSSISEGSR